jgi:hypothetical protein
VANPASARALQSNDSPEPPVLFSASARPVGAPLPEQVAFHDNGGNCPAMLRGPLLTIRDAHKSSSIGGCASAARRHIYVHLGPPNAGRAAAVPATPEVFKHDAGLAGRWPVEPQIIPRLLDANSGFERRSSVQRPEVVVEHL